MSEPKFLVFTQFGEVADLAIDLQRQGHEVLFYVDDHGYRGIGRGTLNHIVNWFDYIGRGYTWIFDSCNFGRLQDYLRKAGELVMGGCEEGDSLENDRQKNQEWFREAGFHQVKSKNFTKIEDALEFAKSYAKSGKRLILKQNGDAPKSINHLGKFPDGSDMIYHLEELKKSWSEQQFGRFDCDLMEVVEGLEVAASVFFNGKDYLKDTEGNVVGFLNFEEKKEADGGTGETCGEMGTTFFGTTDEHELFRAIVMREPLVRRLQRIGFRGVFDINCILSDEGRLVALEPTMRFGVPATSYEFIAGMKDNALVLHSLAAGLDSPVTIRSDFGMVMCVVARPFPIEVDVEDSATSIGEKLWILSGELPVPEFNAKQSERIHLYNFERTAEGYKVVTKGGYLLTVTGASNPDSISGTRKELIKFIKNNIYISGMKYRTDIGKRIEEVEDSLLKNKIKVKK